LWGRPGEIARRREGSRFVEEHISPGLIVPAAGRATKEKKRQEQEIR
jgi:hypothetical protein